MKTYNKVKFKGWYCIVLGLATIFEGVIMILSLGRLSTTLSLRLCLWGAEKNIYRKQNPKNLNHGNG